MLATGTLIDDRFELQSTIGVGGYGAVYKAKQLQFGRTVALKMLATNVLQQDDGPARFEREAQAINALKHKNIVSFYGYGVWNQAPYMVVEFVDGISIQTEIECSGRMDPRRALMLIKQVFEGLASAHASGVIHRDLKPSNIMLTPSRSLTEPRHLAGCSSAATSGDIESVKIIDFGLAKLMPGYGIPGQKLTETGYALGSCHYMPPEQALGIAVDPRADIYAAGCVLYFMLTGQVPFDADNNIAIMMQHLNALAEPVSDSLENHPLSRPLSSFVDNCMVKERDNRYADCNQALAHIDAMLKGDTKSVQSNVVRGVQQKRFVGTKPLILCLAMVASTLLVAVACMTMTSHAPTPTRTAKEIMKAEARTLELRTPSDLRLPLLEKICSMNSVDHSLSAKEEMNVIQDLAFVRRLCGRPIGDVVLSQRILQLVSRATTDPYAVVNSATAMNQLGDRASAISLLKNGFNQSKFDESTASYYGEHLIDIYADNSEWSNITSVGREIRDPSRMTCYWVSVAQLMTGHVTEASNALPEKVVQANVRDRPWQEAEVYLQRARIYLAERQPKKCLEKLKQLEVLVPSVDIPTLDFNLLRLAGHAGARDSTLARETFESLWGSYISKGSSKTLVSYDIALTAGYLKRSPDKLLRESAGDLSKLEKGVLNR